ncbi:MAG: hypothetical protein ACRED4_09345 [Brevundimonas sp.]
MAAIRRAAKSDWPGDAEMQRHIEEAETEAWAALQVLNFGSASPIREAILKEATGYMETWEDRLHFVRDEIEAFEELATLEPDDIPAEEFAAMRSRAEAANDWYALQLDDVRRDIARWRYVRDTRARVTPMRELLVRMEEILGSECYNANIQNYSNWGVWEGEGRSFRYPVTYLRAGGEEKRRSRTSDLAPDELITGHYRFGANEVGVMRALVRVIEMLRDDYGLVLPKADESTIAPVE